MSRRVVDGVMEFDERSIFAGCPRASWSMGLHCCIDVVLDCVAAAALMRRSAGKLVGASSASASHARTSCLSSPTINASMRWGFITPYLHTPHMDAIAQEGVHFRNAFVTTALCSPSRATILTGQYANTHGVVDNNAPIRPGTVFFPSYLQEAGYETAFIGKWHMGHASDEPKPGFDKWVSFRGAGLLSAGTGSQRSARC